MGAKADDPVRARNTVVNKEIAKLANGSDVLVISLCDRKGQYPHRPYLCVDESARCVVQ